MIFCPTHKWQPTAASQWSCRGSCNVPQVKSCGGCKGHYCTVWRRRCCIDSTGAQTSCAMETWHVARAKLNEARIQQTQLEWLAELSCITFRLTGSVCTKLSISSPWVAKTRHNRKALNHGNHRSHDFWQLPWKPLLLPNAVIFCVLVTLYEYLLFSYLHKHDFHISLQWFLPLFAVTFCCP